MIAFWVQTLPILQKGSTILLKEKMRHFNQLSIIHVFSRLEPSKKELWD